MFEFIIAIMIAVGIAKPSGHFPEKLDHWVQISEWEQTENKLFNVAFRNSEIISECQDNPDSYIRFPTVIASYQQLWADVILVAEEGDAEKETISTIYPRIRVSCKQVVKAKELIWIISTPTKYLFSFSYFPLITSARDYSNVSNNIVHFSGSVALAILGFFVFFFFYGSVPIPQLLYYSGTCLAAALFSIVSSAGLFGLDIGQFWAQKVADTFLVIAMLGTVLMFRKQNLVTRFGHSLGMIFAPISLSLILFGRHYEVGQFGTSLFLVAYAIIYFDLILIQTKKLRQRRLNSFEFLSIVFIGLSFYNDFLVTFGVIDTLTLAPVAFLSFCLLSGIQIQQQVANTYTELEKYKIKLQESFVERDLQIEEHNRQHASFVESTQKIVHDIRKPFMLMNVLSNQIRKNSQSVEIIRRFHPEIEKITNYTNSLIENILLAGKQRDNKIEEIKIEDIVDEAWFFTPKKNDRYVLAKIFKHTSYLKADKTKTKRILCNLLSNAVESMPQDAKNLIVKTEDDAGFIKISVWNEGTYISPEKIASIFAPFVSNSEFGTGLGLTICKDLVTSHGGALTCISEPKMGTEFVFTLPAGSLI